MIKRFTFEIDTDDEQKNWTEYFKSVLNSCYESEKADSFMLMNLKEDPRNYDPSSGRQHGPFSYDDIINIAVNSAPAGTLESFASDFADRYRSRVYKFYSGSLHKDICLKYENGKRIRICITLLQNLTRGKRMGYLAFEEAKKIDFDDIDAVNKLLHEIYGNKEN